MIIYHLLLCVFLGILSDLVHHSGTKSIALDVILIIFGVILHLFAFCDIYHYKNIHQQSFSQLEEFDYLYTPNSRYLELRPVRSRWLVGMFSERRRCFHSEKRKGGKINYVLTFPSMRSRRHGRSAPKFLFLFAYLYGLTTSITLNNTGKVQTT